MRGGEVGEVVEALARDEAVVDGDAHLPVLDRLRGEHLLDRLRVDAVRRDDRRALAAQLERNRDELLGRRLRDLAPDRGAARVEEVVPAHARERARELEAADDDVDAVTVERLVHHLAQQLRARGRVIGGLDHDAVARSEHLDQRTDGEVEGEVPGHDVSDHALGLRLHERPPGPVQGGIGRARLGLHPAGELFGRIHRAPGGAEHFDQVGGQRRVHGEVAAQRLLDLRAVAHEHAGERAEQLLALLERRERVDEKGRALPCDRRLELCDRGAVVER